MYEPGELGALIGEWIGQFRGANKDVLKLIKENVSLDDERLKFEIFCLQESAAHLAAYDVLKGSENALKRFDIALRGTLLSHPYLKRAKEGAIKERSDGYTGALGILVTNEAMFMLPPEATTIPFGPNPAENVGKLFAYFCGARSDPIVALAGTGIFAAGVETFRELVSKVRVP